MNKTISQEILHNIRRIQIRTTHLVEDLLGGIYRSAFKGKGMEFEEVREYQLGDEVRHIDWNVTARMDDPYVKSFREERELTVMLVVDISSSLQYGSGSQQKKELVAEIAALLAFSAIKNNDKVGLILFSSEVELYLSPKKGVKHVLHVIKELLNFKAQKKGTDIDAALTFLGCIQKQRCICFLLSDFFCPTFAISATITARRHDFTAIVIRDCQEQNFAPLGLLQLKDIETGVMSWVNTRSHETLRKYSENAEQDLINLKNLICQSGGGFLLLQTDLPYVEKLCKYFQNRKCYVGI